MKHWWIRKYYGAEKLWQSYLVYRVQNETDSGVGRFVELRKVAEDLCRQTNAEYTATIDDLCWLALERGSYYPGHRAGWIAYGNRRDELPNHGLNLLSAAAYFNYIPLASRLLSEGHCPTADNRLLPPPIQLATWAGNIDMLILFQEHLPEFEEIPPRYEGDPKPWRSKIGPGSIKGAAYRGDMNMLRLAIYPPSRSNANTNDICGQKFGQVDPKSHLGSHLQYALYSVKTVEVFQYIDSFFQDSVLLSNSVFLLARYAELGNIEMVRYLLDTGIDIHAGKNRLNENPLHIAIRNCHEDIVDLLLERGADPNNGKSQQRGLPIYAAVDSGSITMVKKILDAGANGYENDWHFLHYAVLHENKAMLELLIESNPGREGSWLYKLRKALDEGPESMEIFIDIDAATSNLGVSS